MRYGEIMRKSLVVWVIREMKTTGQKASLIYVIKENVFIHQCYRAIKNTAIFQVYFLASCIKVKEIAKLPILSYWQNKHGFGGMR